MSHTTEVPIILGRPDYDWPLLEPAESGGGMAASGRDSLSYLWRFEGERASLFAVEHKAVGRLLGAVRLGAVGLGGVAERCVSLRDAQARMRGVQTAYVQLCETLLSMVGEANRAALMERLHAMRERLGDELLMFTDPADDGAHAEFRLVPEVIGIDGPARSDEERAKLRPLAAALLKGHGRALGVEDGDELLGARDLGERRDRVACGRSLRLSCSAVFRGESAGIMEIVASRTSRRTTAGWIVAAVAVCLLALVDTSRVELATRFHLVLADWLDGRIQIDIAEHWYNVLAGHEPWNGMAYFAPARDSLGYNDGYLLNGLIACVFRVFGADEFEAFDLSCIVIRAIGFAAFIVLARDPLRLGWPAAILGAALFTTLDNLAAQGAHAQLLLVALAPLVAWLLWCGVEAQIDNRCTQAALAGCMAALVYGIWLLTAYYMAFFFTLFAAVFLLGLLVQHVRDRDERRRLVAVLGRWPLAVTAGAFVVSTVPFLLVYLPKVRETHMHGFGEVVPYLPSVFDIIDVGPDNLAGRFIDPWLPAFVTAGLEPDGEHVAGFPPLLLLFGVLGILSIVMGRRPRRTAWLALALAVAVSFVLALKVGHHSAWKLVFHFVPGARGVRVVCRFLLFLGLPITLLAVSFLDSRAARWPRWLFASVCVLLLVEEVDVAPPVLLDRMREFRLVASIPPPPAGCRVFYVRHSFARASMPGGVIGDLYPHNVDAMTLAEHIALPTVNGFSTFKPPGWNFASVEQPDYEQRVRDYLRQTGVRGPVCSVDLAHGTWRDG